MAVVVMFQITANSRIQNSALAFLLICNVTVWTDSRISIFYCYLYVVR